MGDIKRKHGKFKRPKKLFDKTRIDEEKAIVQRYGLKNKKEIWKAESEISKLRRRAKMLIPKTEEEKEKFYDKLGNLGFKVDDISDVLAMTKEDWLGRRLQTFVFKRGLANTMKHARQLIVHKQVLTNGKVVNIPSFVVTKNLENKISLIRGRQKVEPRIKKRKENGEESKGENPEVKE